MKTFHSLSSTQTEEFGQKLGSVIEPGDLLALDGELGAGKTTLVRGIAQGLNIDESEVRSPTFVLHHVYQSAKFPLHHLDFYRLGAGAKVQEFDLPTLLADGAVIIEWATYGDIQGFIPIGISINILGGDEREFVLSQGAPQRYEELFVAARLASL